jgi:hypothetical protein
LLRGLLLIEALLLCGHRLVLWLLLPLLLLLV